MTKKRAIPLIEKVNELFKSLFPDGWIDSLEWSDEEKSRKSIFIGKGKISDAESQGRRIKLNFPSTAYLSSPHSIPLSVVLG